MWQDSLFERSFLDNVHCADNISELEDVLLEAWVAVAIGAAVLDPSVVPVHEADEQHPSPGGDVDSLVGQVAGMDECLPLSETERLLKGPKVRASSGVLGFGIGQTQTPRQCAPVVVRPDPRVTSSRRPRAG